MKKYDFIIGYEHKRREIESVCLLKYELERRGYRVLVYSTADKRLKEHWKAFHADVLLLPYANADDVVSFATYWAVTFDKLINLQWEQAIYRQQEETPDSYRNPSGIGREAVHLSWGKANAERLKRIAQIGEKNVKLVGNITLDFLREPLSDYYLSKEEIYKRYGIPFDKKVCLFIASFKSATVSEETLNELCRLFGEWRRKHHEVALKTMQTILAWMQDALDADPDLFFIYRPHPGENTELADEIGRRYKRFIVIKDLSVKQWILVVDKIYTWMSTTVAEVYFAQKSCYILYPYEVPWEAGSRLFDHMESIADYGGFLRSLEEKGKNDFPVDLEILNDYYLTGNRMSYLNIADVCEEVFKDPFYRIDKKEQKRLYRLPGEGFLKKVWHLFWQTDLVYDFFWFAITKLPLKGSYFADKRNTRQKYEMWKKEEFVSGEEIETICENIRKCLEKG